MQSTRVYRADAELPDLSLEWYDGEGNLIDFSAGYNFELKLVSKKDQTVALTKTTNITGWSVAPNVTVRWVSGDLNQTPGRYAVIIKATNNNGDRYFAPGCEPEIKIIPAN